MNRRFALWRWGEPLIFLFQNHIMELHKSAEYTCARVCGGWGCHVGWGFSEPHQRMFVNHYQVELNQHNWILPWRVLLSQNVVPVHVPVNSESSLPRPPWALGWRGWDLPQDAYGHKWGSHLQKKWQEWPPKYPKYDLRSGWAHW